MSPIGVKMVLVSEIRHYVMSLDTIIREIVSIQSLNPTVHIILKSEFVSTIALLILLTKRSR